MNSNYLEMDLDDFFNVLEQLSNKRTALELAYYRGRTEILIEWACSIDYDVNPSKFNMQHIDEKYN